MQSARKNLLGLLNLLSDERVTHPSIIQSSFLILETPSFVCREALSFPGEISPALFALGAFVFYGNRKNSSILKLARH